MADTRTGEDFVVVSHGMLGYGVPETSLDAAVAIGCDLIAVDAGSTDPGPFYLGSGELFGNEAMVRRDLDLLLEAQEATGAKIVIGSAGGGGSDVHLDKTMALLREAIAKSGRPRRVATISSELSKDEVRQALRERRVRGFETGAELGEADIDSSLHIVAQIGVEPIIAAIRDEPDIVLCGRAWDPGNIAALPIARGYDRGLAIHAGKILECGAQAALPVEGSDLLLGRIGREHFVVEALQPHKRCTVASVAAHTLYEKTDPVLLPGPGGRSDLRNSVFEQLDERRVRVSGSRFVPDDVHTVKLEGARLAGWRCVMIAGIRDPLMIAHIKDIQTALAERVSKMLSGRIAPSQYSAHFHRYGLDGVMGSLEPSRVQPHEIGLVLDVVADTEANASTVAATYRSLLMHWSYPGRKATAGNLAFPFSPAEFRAGPVYEFSVYHLLEIDDPARRFTHRLEVVQ
jgi:hypothetical protein